MKRTLLFSVLSIFLVLSRSQAQNGDMVVPMIDAMQVKAKMMDPAVMVAAEGAMKGDQSVVPSIVAKEVLIHEMMTNEGTLPRMQMAAMASESGKPKMADEGKLKMAIEKMMADDSQLQLIFQELVARYLASQRIELQKGSPDEAGRTKVPMLDENAMAEGKAEMMTGDAMTKMMVKESLLQGLLKDPEVMGVVEKQARSLQNTAMYSMIADKNLMMRIDAMTKEPAEMKAVLKEAMMRSSMGSRRMMMD